jgi:hypothetical protein
MKQETIEEAAKSILANNFDGLRDVIKDDDLFYFYKGVIECYGEAMAEWKQEKICSSEVIQRIRASKSDAEARRIIRTT